MALSDQDREWVRLTARELTFAVFKEILPYHIKTCPFGLRLRTYRAVLIGFGVGVGVAGGAGGWMIVRAVLGL